MSWSSDSLGQLVGILSGLSEVWPWYVREAVPAYLFQLGPGINRVASQCLALNGVTSPPLLLLESEEIL